MLFNLDVEIISRTKFNKKEEGVNYQKGLLIIIEKFKKHGLQFEERKTELVLTTH